MFFTQGNDPAKVKIMSEYHSTFYMGLLDYFVILQPSQTLFAQVDCVVPLSTQEGNCTAC